MVSVYLDNNIKFPANEWEKVAFDTVVFDDYSEFDSIDQHAYAPKGPGRYRISGALCMAVARGQDRITIRIKVGGDTKRYFYCLAVSGYQQTFLFDAIIEVPEGIPVTVWVRNKDHDDQVYAGDDSTWLQIVKL